MKESDAYKYFVLRAQKIALSHGYELVNWYVLLLEFKHQRQLSHLISPWKIFREETFNDFGSELSRKTVVHNWYVIPTPNYNFPHSEQ